MWLLRTFAPWCLVVFLGHQVSPSSGERRTPAPGSPQRSANKPAANGRGKFSTVYDGDKMQCAWGAKDEADTVRLSVKCENPEARVKGGVTDLKCKYSGRPQRCPGYQSDPKGFWKQVARAFKKLQGKACTDDRALLRASMCKRAPEDAHFKLEIETSVVSAQSGREEAPPPTPTLLPSRPTPTNCTGRAEARRKAEETCGGSWVSLCSFVYAMLQRDDCQHEQ